MLETLASVLVLAIGLYAAIGVLFALFFVLRGVKGVDPSAAEGTWGFRVLIFPGAVALWPLLARRLRKGAPPDERNAHRDLASKSGAPIAAASSREGSSS